MEMKYLTIGTNTYLTYQVKDEDQLDKMGLGMLTNNTIPGIADASFMQMDTEKFIQYNVTAKIPASQLFSGTVNRKRLLGVFSGVLDAVSSAEDYMLEQNSIMLDLDYIFTDVTTCETVLIYLPILNGSHENPGLGQFFKNIMFNTQFDQQENCDHVTKILSYLNANPILSVADFKETLKNLETPISTVNSAPQHVVHQEPPKVQVQTNVGYQITPQVIQQPVRTVSQPNCQNLSDEKENIMRAEVFQPVISPVKQQIKASEPVDANNSNEKPMSMFYLLQHYSKENAAKYKQQQDAKKAQTASAEANKKDKKKESKKDNKKNKPAKKENVPAGVSFAVPNQNNAPQMNFAVPNSGPALEQPKQEIPAAQAPVIQYQTQAPQYQQFQSPMVQKQPIESKHINFGETTVLGSSAVGETTVLTNVPDASRPAPHLIRMKNNEKIPINKPSFRIGKERSYVDYFIGDNTAISRAHANIIDHNGNYFVMDTNSTNHTYVDGAMIQSNTEVPLSHGIKIRLANEEFEFRLY